MASAKKLATGSGSAFAIGAVAGVVGNNLGQGPWYWAGFVTLTVTGTALTGWLTYRGATPATGPASHQGNNTIKGGVHGKDQATVTGVNYGTTTGTQQAKGEKA